MGGSPFPRTDKGENRRTSTGSPVHSPPKAQTGKKKKKQPPRLSISPRSSLTYQIYPPPPPPPPPLNRVGSVKVLLLLTEVH